MPLHRSRRGLTVILCCLVLGSAANAADQGITGKKLLLKSNPKMVLLSKDALVVPGANGSSSDPRCVPDGGSGSGASVKLDDGSNSVTLNMPCANWSTNGAGTLYKYKDAAGTPKVGKLKAGLLKVVSPGMGGFPVPSGAAAVNVEVTVGSDKYCMMFSGTGDGTKFLVKDSTAGTCAPTQTCGNNLREGTEQCDGADAPTCPTWCGIDCTCPPATSCGGSYPSCGGACAVGSCYDDSPRGCVCLGIAGDCGGLSCGPCGVSGYACEFIQYFAGCGCLGGP